MYVQRTTYRQHHHLVASWNKCWVIDRHFPATQQQVPTIHMPGGSTGAAGDTLLGIGLGKEFGARLRRKARRHGFANTKNKKGKRPAKTVSFPLVLSSAHPCLDPPLLVRCLMLLANETRASCSMLSQAFGVYRGTRVHG